ncbi:MAG: tRNA dihydrouridine synthase DusB [Erysipelotrichaceae bacterium]|nr:tRNA dihydrouridine synthase DusB [Erysipelotrichaceae bacterium]
MQIGNIKIERPVIVAPMAGVTNGAFRQLCLEFGAGLVCCEMVSDKAIYYCNTKTGKMLELDEDVHPVSLQIFGSDPDTMAYAAKVLDEKTNCDIIDINMGCPVTKVIKTGAGSALMKDEDLACEIVKRVLEVTNKPVTVKMRLGFDCSHLNYLSLAKKLEKLGVAAITLHGRTRSQMYDGTANWEHIKTLKENLSIPVIGNGDIKTVEDYIKYKDYCDGIMIGRGLIGNPFLIQEINNYVDGKENFKVPYSEKIEMCKVHTRKLIDLKGEIPAIREMRGLAPHYITGLYKSSIYKNMMSKINTYEDLDNLLNDYLKVLDEFESQFISSENS